MKKLLLTGLLIAFAGTALTEKPEILNPPRPTKQYKWLLVIQHQGCLGLGCRAYLDSSELHSSTYFVYVNDYELAEINYLEGGGYEIVSRNSENDLEIYAQHRSGEVIGPIFYKRQQVSTTFSVTKVFLKSPAPKPAKDSINTNRLIIKPASQKAKVVFTK